ncbi:polysaccharide biosynthesis/export family protein [Desulfonatronovibrio magnus]|uniref:polysaccharide biosynthesis/export family protein n=1 Tax=Desulfonatronovibrio magnus TaxID=698827 RepID=UPI002FC38D63
MPKIEHLRIREERRMKRILFVMYLFGMLFCSLAWADNENQQYLLSPGDMLEISVWNDESLYREVMIRPDGRISFPLIGDMVAAGKTVENVRIEMEESIDKYVPGTPVTVILNYISYPVVYIVGKVVNPGLYLMEKDTTVIQALAMAGGLNPFASRNNILIIRQNSKEQQMFNFRYTDVENGRSLERNIALKDGDTIVVP